MSWDLCPLDTGSSEVMAWKEETRGDWERRREAEQKVEEPKVQVEGPLGSTPSHLLPSRQGG